MGKTGRAKRRVQYNRRLVNVVPTWGRPDVPSAVSSTTDVSSTWCPHSEDRTCQAPCPVQQTSRQRGAHIRTQEGTQCQRSLNFFFESFQPGQLCSINVIHWVRTKRKKKKKKKKKKNFSLLPPP